MPLAIALVIIGAAFGRLATGSPGEWLALGIQYAGVTAALAASGATTAMLVSLAVGIGVEGILWPSPGKRRTAVWPGTPFWISGKVWRTRLASFDLMVAAVAIAGALAFASAHPFSNSGVDGVVAVLILDGLICGVLGGAIVPGRGLLLLLAAASLALQITGRAPPPVETALLAAAQLGVALTLPIDWTTSVPPSAEERPVPPDIKGDRRSRSLGEEAPP